MPYPRVRGISAAYQHELIDLLADLAATPGLDVDVGRRADYLRLGLEGHRPENDLPFVDNAGPLAPAAPACARARVTA